MPARCISKKPKQITFSKKPVILDPVVKLPKTKIGRFMTYIDEPVTYVQKMERKHFIKSGKEKLKLIENAKKSGLLNASNINKFNELRREARIERLKKIRNNKSQN